MLANTPALLRPANRRLIYLSYCSIFGALGENRTPDTRIFNPVLYRLSYKCILVYRVGIEPTTYGLRVRRSTAELPVHYFEDTLGGNIYNLCSYYRDGYASPQCIIKVMVDPVGLEPTYSD